MISTLSVPPGQLRSVGQSLERVRNGWITSDCAAGSRETSTDSVKIVLAREAPPPRPRRSLRRDLRRVRDALARTYSNRDRPRLGREL